VTERTRLATAPTLAAAVQQWERSWPGGGRTLADWLHRHDLLEPVEAGRAIVSATGAASPEE